MNDSKRKFYMDKALKQAFIAFKKGEVPIGAVVINSNGDILSRAYNKTEKNGCQVYHAEVLAIKKACKKIGTWRLDGCSIYVTIEPCLMCFGLIQLSRIENLYFGASCKEFGSGLAKARKHKLYRKNLKISGGIEEKRCIKLIKDFFIILRKKRREYSETKNGISRKSEE
ncbi:tRNA-specific adenosine deaminase [Candidatus Dependentiae bacterium]|nr:tRNA-specific adenosine deaminase [Candidatus Dependentiae bacterium]